MSTWCPVCVYVPSLAIVPELVSVPEAGARKHQGDRILRIVKHGAVEFDGLEDFRQDIYSPTTRLERTTGKVYRTSKQVIYGLALFCQENQTPG